MGEARNLVDGPPGGSFWLRVGERFGVPVALCAVLLFAAWACLQWTANNVLLPLTARHLKFLDVSEETQKATVEAVRKVGEGIEEFKDNQEEAQSLLKKLVESSENTETILRATRIRSDKDSAIGGPNGGPGE